MKDLISKMDSIAEANEVTPSEFKPTHFHKGNLGNINDLMMTKPGIFWWEGGTYGMGDDGRMGERIVRWQGNTKNRSAINPASVDGIYIDGKPVEFPEGVTWDTYQPPVKPEVKPEVKPDVGQGGKTAPCAEKIAKLNALIQKLAAAKKGDSGQGGKPADSGDVMQRLQQVGVPVKEGAELGIEQQLLLEFGYAELDEYSMQQFSQDAGDTGRGLWNGVTLGAGDNIVAGARSLVKGTKYKDELGKELAATKDAETRSPYLYGGSNLAGSILAPIPGGAAGALAAKGAKALGAGKGLTTAASLGGNVAANIAAAKAVGSAVDAHNADVLGKDGQGGKPQGDPKVWTLQGKLIAAGAKIKQDGKMGPATQAAMKQFPTVKESVAESMGSLRDRLAMLEQEQTLDEADITKLLGRLFGKSADDTATAATKPADKVAPSVVTRPPLQDTVRLSGETWTKTGNTFRSNTGKVMSADDMALKLGKVDKKLSPGGTKVQGQGTVAANAGARTQSAMANMARGGADDAASAGAKVTGKAADDVAGVAGKAADDVAGTGAKAADNVVDDAAKAAAAAEAQAASKMGKLAQWTKANPGKAKLIGLAGLGAGAYVASRVLGGDDTGQGPASSDRPTTPPTVTPPAAPSVDTSAIETEITSLIKELEKEPECQKELEALKQQLAGITGKTTPATSTSTSASTQVQTDDDGNHMITTPDGKTIVVGPNGQALPNGGRAPTKLGETDELARWLKIARS